MADAIVSIVAEQIAAIVKEQIAKEVNLVRGVNQKVFDLSEQLNKVRDVLEDAEKKRFVDKIVRSWLVRLEDASYKMEDVLDMWQTDLLKAQIQQQQQSNATLKNKVCSFISCSCLPKIVVRRDIAEKIENGKARLDLILAEKDCYGLVMSTNPSSWKIQSTSFVDLAEVHGRDIDRDVVVNKISVMAPPCRVETDGRQLEIVSIVGVGGVGKTTLAQLVFNDTRVKDCFELLIWICVSDPFDVVEIVKKIVESVKGSSPESNQLEVLVQNHLKACILGKKFLLVLDDVWTEDITKWELLKNSLKLCCGMGSKILVTTRNEKVAKTLDTHESGIHRLGVLSDESCWLLLKRISLFDKNEDECAEYKDIGMKIVDKCKGLPLAAKTLGSVLRCKNNLEEWKNVLNSEIWELEEAQVDIFPHLLLSYNDLSPALKRCFSYCAVFPKVYEIQVDTVIREWMALGYLGSDIGSGCEMELRGREYFDRLAMCSLFQDFTKYDLSMGGKIKSFKLHDIVHDFAQFLRKNDTVIVEAGTNKKTSCQHCSPQLVSQVKEYRILFWDDKDSPICGCLRSLRVLRLRRNARIPQGIKIFIHLRWLDMSYNRDLSVREGLKTICNELCNLQTLLLCNCKLQEIPREIGNLINLRHLDLSWNYSLKELPREIGNLINLRHPDLSWNYFLKELPKEIGNLMNLRHLNLNMNDSLKKLPREIENLTNLRHLDLSENRSIEELPENICYMRELETLKINGCRMLSKLPQGIHRLVNLKHLHNFDTPSLRQFPQGIAKLTCLRTLSEFRVGKDMRKLGWLKNLNRLGGDILLSISLSVGSGNMVDVEDARDGELRNKEYLQGLKIVFDDVMYATHLDNEVEDCLRMDVIDALQPHPNLQDLTIHYFHGSRLPEWIVSPLNKVKTIFLSRFGHLTSMSQPLGKLPCLEQIQIERMHEMRFVRREFLGTTTETTIVFPNLKKLTFEDCPNWEEWEDITVQEEDDKFMSLMPRLKELNITKCNSLTALPHRLLRKVASSLVCLDISDSSQLMQRYGDKEGSPWKSISHINPRIHMINPRDYFSSS